jgi:hypothetical protein
MANDIITHRDALRYAARRTAISVGLAVVLTVSLCLLQFGTDPDAFVRAGLVTKSGIMISMIVSGLLTAGLSYRSALMMRELALTRATATACQSAFKFDPGSASNFDPFERRVLTIALASSELAGVAETRRARAA